MPPFVPACLLHPLGAIDIHVYARCSPASAAMAVKYGWRIWARSQAAWPTGSPATARDLYWLGVQCRWMSEWYCRQRRVVVVVKRRADGFVWCPPFGQCRCRLLCLDSARALLPATGCDPAGKSVLPPVSVSVVRLGSVPTQSQSENYYFALACCTSSSILSRWRIYWTMELVELCDTTSNCSRWTLFTGERRRRRLLLLLIDMASEATDIRKKALLVKIKVTV